MEKRFKLFAIILIIYLCCTSAFTIDYTNLNFSDFNEKQFTPKNVKESYYDSFNIYYKSYEYQGYECITEYYLVGYKQGEPEIIMYNCFTEVDTKLRFVRYDSKGNELQYTNISGYLYYEDHDKYSGTNLEVYGFSEKVLQKPFSVYILFVFNGEYNGQNGQMNTESISRSDYDYKNNILKSWSPE
ncbi:MAG: hypothetical protein J5747_04335 [Spirochaetaceae bacterium]|nr:hypothetical protein [Spirochaetaceae bacterium]